MDRSNRSPAAVIAGWLVLAALVGCDGEQTVASKSAAAFREAQKRGEAFGADGHGHGAVTSGGRIGAHEDMPGEAAAEGAAPGHEHAGTEAPAGEAMHHDGAHGMAHPEATPGAAGVESAAGHAAMKHGQRPASGGHAPAPAGRPPAEPFEESVAVPAGQPAATLLPDALDAPAATSVADAQRSAEMALEMTGGGHGAHGAGTYRQVDAGRETTPQHQHHPTSPPAPPERQEDKEHDHEPPDGGGWAAAERSRA